MEQRTGSQDAEATRAAVRDRYGRIAENAASGADRSGAAVAVSERIGYTAAEMTAVPEGANLGLGCGNPTALAQLRAGETVLDLGSGAGFDAFLAAQAVGPQGRVIGVDMTPEMVANAQENARKVSVRNTEFRLGTIEALPVDDQSIDVVISNCVINLSPDKPRVFREAFRVLKPGGRLMVSDIVLRAPLSEHVRTSIEAYVGCIAGAALEAEYLDAIARAGFADVEVVKQTDATALLGAACCTAADPIVHEVADALGGMEELRRVAAGVASITVTARKPV